MREETISSLFSDKQKKLRFALGKEINRQISEDRNLTALDIAQVLADLIVHVSYAEWKQLLSTDKRKY